MGRKAVFSDPYHIEHRRLSKKSYDRAKPGTEFTVTKRILQRTRRKRMVCCKCKKGFELGQTVVKSSQGSKNRYHKECFQSLFPELIKINDKNENVHSEIHENTCGETT